MNKPLLKQVATTTGVALLLFAMALMINSCRKDHSPGAGSKNVLAVVNDARSWYQSSYPLSIKGSRPVTQSTDESADLSQLMQPRLGTGRQLHTLWQRCVRTTNRPGQQI